MLAADVTVVAVFLVLGVVVLFFLRSNLSYLGIVILLFEH